MPYRPNHPCSSPGCPALVPPGTSRCLKHPLPQTLGQRPYQRPAADAFYGAAEWKRFRAKVLKERGNACVRCGIITPSPHLDHIHPVRTHPELALDERNVQVLCREHHSAKTLGEVNRR